eukprot:TRINITY_DN13628_c0_g1_i2.p1 TRINITY_DN13628_c0_g1~~TRINITY_DN13628_c0_g1_i2.p1  ORF type:complete len:426 (+),score=-21.10 TRINITY_DN13628_c0_g1_i2:1-1278(+)
MQPYGADDGSGGAIGAPKSAAEVPRGNSSGGSSSNGSSSAKLRLFKLPNNSFGAKCLDGSPPAYYFRPGAGAGRLTWHIHLPGGGWCFSAGECAYRSHNYLGGSGQYPMEADESMTRFGFDLGGLLSGNGSVNADFRRWALVRLVYCDGGAYAGTRGRWAVNSSVTLYSDGWKIVQAVIADLRARHGLASAARVLLSGSSAGGQAVAALCDEVAQLLRPARTKCFVDSGVFVDTRSRTGSREFRSLAVNFTAVHRPHYPMCTQGGRFNSTPWQCFFAVNTLANTSTPVFVFQSLFDIVALTFGKQLPLGGSYSIRCLGGILQGGYRATTAAVRDQSWDELQMGAATCDTPDRDAAFNAAYAVYDGLRNVTDGNDKVVAFAFTSYLHCSAIRSDVWPDVRIGREVLYRVFAHWVMKYRKQRRFIHS